MSGRSSTIAGPLPSPGSQARELRVKLERHAQPTGQRIWSLTRPRNVVGNPHAPAAVRAGRIDRSTISPTAAQRVTMKKTSTPGRTNGIRFHRLHSPQPADSCCHDAARPHPARVLRRLRSVDRGVLKPESARRWRACGCSALRHVRSSACLTRGWPPLWKRTCAGAFWINLALAIPVAAYSSLGLLLLLGGRIPPTPFGIQRLDHARFYHPVAPR
jgi:hypothetical protein